MTFKVELIKQNWIHCCLHWYFLSVWSGSRESNQKAPWSARLVPAILSIPTINMRVTKTFELSTEKLFFHYRDISKLFRMSHLALMWPFSALDQRLPIFSRNVSQMRQERYVLYLELKNVLLSAVNNTLFIIFSRNSINRSMLMIDALPVNGAPNCTPLPWLIKPR